LHGLAAEGAAVGGAIGAAAGAIAGGVGGSFVIPGIGTVGGAAAGAAEGALWGGVGGAAAGCLIQDAYNWSTADDETEEDDNCEALYQSTLRTCASLTQRKQFACVEAARINREQYCQEKGKQVP
jgi:phage tail tape-measure protein